MYFTGFADEAAVDIAGQIRATQELGWKYIESRGINGKNIHDLTDAEFDRAAGALQDAGIGVNCFGSAIANWGKSIEQPGDSSVEEARRAIPRMKRLGARLIRIMSFAIRKDHDPRDQMAEERYRRLGDLYRMFNDEGLTPVHENCMNYGGMGWPYTLDLVEHVPGLRLVFDTGNPVFDDDMTHPKPYPRQSAWEFYTHVRDHIAYIHVKDGVWESARQKARFTFPGEGEGDVRRVLKDLLQRGYDGGLSIEPHLAAVAHDASVQSTEQIKYSNYVEYGRRLMTMVDEIKRELK